MRCRLIVIKSPVLWQKALLLDLQCRVTKAKQEWAYMDVGPNFLASEDPTASPIWTGKAPFEGPVRWKEDGANRKAIVTTPHVQRQADGSIGGWRCTRRKVLIWHQKSAASNAQKTAGSPAAAWTRLLIHRLAPGSAWVRSQSTARRKVTSCWNTWHMPFDGWHGVDSKNVQRWLARSLALCLTCGSVCARPRRMVRRKSLHAQNMWHLSFDGIELIPKKNVQGWPTRSLTQVSLQGLSVQGHRKWFVGISLHAEIRDIWRSIDDIGLIPKMCRGDWHGLIAHCFTSGFLRNVREAPTERIRARCSG